jgi:hypothetical protein
MLKKTSPDGLFLARFFANQFKRSALPNGPKIASGGSLSPLILFLALCLFVFGLMAFAKFVQQRQRKWHLGTGDLPRPPSGSPLL